MLCPHCGYLMSPLDLNCERCRQRGFAPPAANASAAPHASAMPLPAPTAPPAAASAAPLPHAACVPPAFPQASVGYAPPAAPAAAPTVVVVPIPPAPAPRTASPLAYIPLVIVAALGAVLIMGAYSFRARVEDDINQRSLQAARADAYTAAAIIQAGQPTVVVRPPSTTVVVNQAPELTQAQIYAAEARARQEQAQRDALIMQQRQLQELSIQSYRTDRDRQIQQQRQLQQLQQQQEIERANAQLRLQEAQRQHQQQVSQMQQQQEAERAGMQRRLQEAQQQNQTTPGK